MLRKRNLQLIIADEDNDAVPEPQPQQEMKAAKIEESKSLLLSPKAGLPHKHPNMPSIVIQGPEPSQDLSYKWVLKYQNV